MDKVLQFIRYAALFIGFFATSFFAVFLISECIVKITQGYYKQIALMVFMLFAVLGYILVAMNKKAGIYFMLGSGLILMIYMLVATGGAEMKPALVFGLPVIIPALMLMFVANFKKKR